MAYKIETIVRKVVESLSKSPKKKKAKAKKRKKSSTSQGSSKNVIKNAQKFFSSGQAKSWSQAMKMAWRYKKGR